MNLVIGLAVMVVGFVWFSAKMIAGDMIIAATGTAVKLG